MTLNIEATNFRREDELLHMFRQRIKLSRNSRSWRRVHCPHSFVPSKTSVAGLTASLCLL